MKDPDNGGTWGLVKLIDYVIPIEPFPWHVGSKSGPLEDTWAVQAAGPLWYLRAYLWFVIASPLLLWAFRRVPWATLLAPLALTAVLGTGLVTIPGGGRGNAISDFTVYGGCWVLGFAHHEGVLRRVRYLAISCSALLMAFGLWWASGRLGPDGWDLNDIPLAQAAWSFGFVVILLQYSPSSAGTPRPAGPLGQADHPVQQPGRHDLPLAQHADHGHGPDHRPGLQPPVHAERQRGGRARLLVHGVDVSPGLAPHRPDDPGLRLDRGHRRQAQPETVAQRREEEDRAPRGGATGSDAGRGDGTPDVLTRSSPSRPHPEVLTVAPSLS